MTAPTQDEIAQARVILNRTIKTQQPMTEAENVLVNKVSAWAQVQNRTKALDNFTSELSRKLGQPGGAPDQPSPSGPFDSAWTRARTMGLKALVQAGSTGLGQAFDPTPVPIPRQGSFIQDLIPKETLTEGDAFKYMRMITRTNNAAIVPAGSQKPTSVFTTQDKADTLNVYAHLSEYIPSYLLADNNSLARFLDTEMRLGVNRAIEADFVSKILADSDIATVSVPGGDDVRTIRRAIRILEQAFVPSSSLVLVISPQDSEELDLKEFTTTAGTGSSGYKFGGPNTGDGEAWHVPVMVSNALSAGQGLIGDFASGLRMYTDNLVKLDLDDKSRFDFNESRVRCETRAELATLMPSYIKELQFIIGS